MKLIKNLILSFVIFILLLVLVSYLLPQKQNIERTLVIATPAEKIFPHMSNPKLFSEWSPWSKLDPKMKVEYSGPESGVGAMMEWQSDEPSVGNGSWKVVEAIENESLDIAMDFGDQGTASSYFRLKPSGDKTSVTWGFDTDAGMNPLMRWFGLLLDKMIGTEYEKGLTALKSIVEAN